MLPQRLPPLRPSVYSWSPQRCAITRRASSCSLGRRSPTRSFSSTFWLPRTRASPLPNLTTLTQTLIRTATLPSFRRSYEAARLKAESLFTTRKETVTLYTRECLKSSSAGATDPCCNTSIAWKGPPCLPRNVSFTVDSYSAPVENLAATCPTQTDCTGPFFALLNSSFFLPLESFVRDFSNTQLSEQLQTCAKSAPDESFLVRQTMQVLSFFSSSLSSASLSSLLSPGTSAEIFTSVRTRTSPGPAGSTATARAECSATTSPVLV